MGRLERFIPENRAGVLVEVTGRTIGARALLSPGPNPRLFNESVVGVMGRALEVSPIEICGCVFMSNHYHALVVVRDQQQLTRFMHHFLGNLSKEVGRLRGWSGALWSRRYDAIVVSHEAEAQWRSLKYLISHGVKEGLVESPLDWPGVHTAKALVQGEELEGCWFNRSKECAARHCGREFGTYDFATRYRIGLAPLPAFRGLTPEAYREKIAELVTEIEEEGRKKRDGRSVAGIERILNQNPHEPPTRKPKKSPKRLFHVASREVFHELWGERAAYQVQFREASEALRQGKKLEAAQWFPTGCYPPALPYVGERSPSRPPSPPTRRLKVSESGVVERGEIPVVVLGAPGRSRPTLVQDSKVPRVRGRP